MAWVLSNASDRAGLVQYLTAGPEDYVPTDDRNVAGVLPNPRLQKKLGWLSLRRLVPRSGTSPPVELARWWETGLEDDWLSVLPFRTLKDRSIRRSRAYDLWRHAKKLDWLKPLSRRLVRGSWDYIGALNLLWAAAIFGREWAERWIWLGACNSGQEHFLSVAKYAHVWLKANACRLTIPDWRRYAECVVLGGFRNPPYPGFDQRREAEALAAGGVSQPAPPGLSFEQAAEKALAMTAPEVAYMTFSDWVASGLWATSGASSEGRVDVTIDGKVHRVKARKNLVLDVMDVDELVTRAESNCEQKNVVLIKAELGKIRLAVSSDLLTYLQMTWVTYLTGGAYRQWPGSTTQEDGDAQAMRMDRMLRLLVDGYSLPFDYAAFDHQPTTSQLVTIWRRLALAAQSNVPTNERPKFDSLVDRVVRGFETATLTSVDDQGSVTMPITGGLMSGLGITSIIGNAWNTVKTYQAEWVGRQLFGAWRVDRYIRGDDSAIFSPDYLAVSGINIGYDVVRALGGVGKFSIQWRQTEFLRIWYDRVCHGYAVRALPGITQRKPWSSQPWSEVGVISAIIESCNTMVRRGEAGASAALATLVSVWCGKHRIPKVALSTPRSRGGFGLLPWDGMSRISPSWGLLERPVFPVSNLNSRRADVWLARADELGIPLSADDARELALSDVSDTLRNDDVPVVAEASRRAWKEWLKRPRVTRSDVWSDPGVAFSSPIPNDLGLAIIWRDDAMVRQAAYGKWAMMAPVIADASRMLASSGGSLSEWLRARMPSVWDDVHRLRRRHHMTLVMQWLLGDVEFVTTSCHPSARSFVLASILNSLPQFSSASGNFSAAVAARARAAETVWLTSTVSRRLFSW